MISIFSLISCSSITDSKKNKESKLFKSLNVENLDYEHAKFDTLSKNQAQEYVDISYKFLQTSKFKRHLNTIGILADTTNYKYIKRLSYSYKKAGEHQKAIKLMNLAIETETNPGEKLGHMGYAAWSYLYFYRDYKKTLSTVNKMLSISNNDYGIACHGEPCLLLKGQSLYRNKQYQEAIKTFNLYQNYQKAQGYNPMDNFLVVFYKARCQMELNQLDKALINFSYLIKDNPNAETHYQISKIYLLKANDKDFKEHLFKAEKYLKAGYVFKEPYFERFDKLFGYMINDLKATNSISF